MSTDTERAAAFREWDAAATHDTYSHEHAFNAGADWQARAAIAQQPAPDCGHGHVYPRADGAKAKCGGPQICPKCRIDLEAKQRAAIAQPAEPAPEQVSDSPFDQAIHLYAQAAWHHDMPGMRKGYMALRELCNPSAAQADAQPVAQYRRLLEPYAVFDAEGLLGPQKPFSWETVARVAVDFANAALAAPPARQPLTDEQALDLARKHLDKGLSWAPRITRCTDLEIRALIRAIEAAHGITQEGE
jgi:hypothetical protein